MSLTVNDTAPKLSGTCTNRSGNVSTPADLTAATLAVHIQRPDRSVLTKTGVLGTTPTDGTWTATWVTGDLNQEGNYKVEVQVTYAGGAIQTFGPDTFYVQRELA